MRHDRIAAALLAPQRVESVDCDFCEGEGEVSILALDARDYRIEDCAQCGGTGKIKLNIKEVENG